MAQISLPSGFRFHPTDVELVSYYLKRKIMGKKLNVDAISEVDLYKFPPWDLPEKSSLRSKDLEWFFFCPRDKKIPNGSRTNRDTPNGYWKTCGKDRMIMLNSRIVGMKKTLIFHEGKDPKGDRTDWVMYEYKMEDEDLVSAGFSKDDFVLCKIFKKSGLGPRIGEQYGTSFNEAEWDNAEAETSMFPLTASSEVVNPTEVTQHAVPFGAAHELPPQNTSAGYAGEESSFENATTTTCVDGSAIQDIPAPQSVDGVVSGINLSNGANDMYIPHECDGFLFEELSRFPNDGSPFRDTPLGEVEMKSTLSIIEAPMSSSLGAMGPLLRKLDLMLASKSQLRRSVKDTIKLLKEDLEEIIPDLMDLSNVECPNYKARYWMHEVRELSYHIEDCIDSMMQVHTAAQAKVRSVRRLQFRVCRVNIPWLPKTVKPSARIAELRTLLREASERYERYELQDCVSEPSRLLFSGNSRPPASSVAAANLVGVDGMRDKLTSWIIDQVEQQLKVLSIVGCVGVGKTALIKELYRELGQQFECQAFIRVSRNPDMKRLLGEVLSQVQGHKQDYHACAADNLIERIRLHLQDKRYFVVIDELWEAAAWDIISIAFPKGNNRSRVIITAEVKDVAVKCCGYQCASTFEITPLGSLQDSGKIFFDRVFGSEHKCPDQLKDISFTIIRCCGGLPMAITTIAGLLASQIDNTELWHHLQHCLFSRLTSLTLEEMVKEIVNICYDALPQNLKTCMLYLTMYPEGCTIWKDNLLKQWIAEGFIRSTDGKQAVAESYFDELINRGMIQPDKINYNDEVLSCTVHHITFDLVAQKSREENFITAVDYSKVMPRFSMIIRRLSLYCSCAQFVAKPEGIKLSQVRSLAFFGLHRCMPSVTKFKFLRVLILEFWGDSYDHTSLDFSKMCILFQLRYLKISSHVPIILPSEIHRLQSLETLEIDAEVPGVPTGILLLPGLLHLSLPDGTKLPEGIGRITSLQTLEYFDLSNNSEDNVRSLGDLINLQNLHVTCSIALSDNHLKRNLAALSSSLGRLANLQSLRVGPWAVGMTMSTDEGGMSCTPMLLQRLELLPPSCIFSRLPRWIGGLQKLRTLNIVVRVLLSSDIDTLTGLHGLTVLSLYVQNCNSETVVFNSGALLVLKYFKYSCGALRLTFQEEALPNLQRLKLCFNVHRDESNTSKLAGIEHLLKLKGITAEIGAAAGADEADKRAAKSVLKEAIRKHPRFPISVNVKWVDCIKEKPKPVGVLLPIPYILGVFLLAAVAFILCHYGMQILWWEQE